MFLPVQTQNCGGDLPQGHLGNIAGGNTQDGKSFQRIEVVDMGKVLTGEIFLWVNAAPGQHHIGHAVFQQVLEPCPCAVIVQIFQQAASLNGAKISVIVAEIIFHNNLCYLHQALAKIRLVGQFTVAVFQSLNDGILILRLHLPDRDSTPFPAVGIRHIKDVPQTIALVSIHQQGNSRGAPIYPPSMLIPEVDFSASGSVRLLSEDQELVTKTILEVVGSGVQECHIIPAVGSDLIGSLHRKLNNGF